MTTLLQMTYEDLQLAFKNCLKDAIQEIRELPVQPEPPDRIGLVEAMEVTGMSKSLIYKLSMKGDIPCKKFGSRRLVFSRKELQQWMESLTTPKTSPDIIATDQLAREARKKL